MSRSLWESKGRMEKASEKQIIHSKMQRSLNESNLKISSSAINLRFYKKCLRVGSQFKDLLIEEYPGIYEEIRDKAIAKYGNPLTKKEYFTQEINKMNNTPKGIFMKRRLLKRFNKKDALQNNSDQENKK